MSEKEPDLFDLLRLFDEARALALRLRRRFPAERECGAAQKQAVDLLNLAACRAGDILGVLGGFPRETR